MTALREAPAVARGDARSLDGLVAWTGEIAAATGFDFDAPLDVLMPGADGIRRIQLDELGRLELCLGPVDAGYLVANGTLRDLPPGSHLDSATGRFTWLPGVGYIGTYRLAFARGGEQVSFAVTIRPRPSTRPGQSEIRMFVDLPKTGQTLAGTFAVAGWALDPQAAFGSGIGVVDVWARRRDVPGATPVFLGSATLGGARPDLARSFGAQFDAAGFGLTTSGLAPGRYEITVYAWNRRTARWEDARTLTVAVR